MTVLLYDATGVGFGPEPEDSWNCVTVLPVEGGVTSVRFRAQTDHPETSGALPVSRGRTVDDETDEPVSGALIVTRDELPTGRFDAKGKERWMRRRIASDAEGAFEVPDLIDRRVHVIVRIDRPELCHVIGEVSGRTGQLPRHVPVFLPYTDEGGWTMAKIDKHGFDAGGVERGRYLVALIPENDDDTDGPMALLPDVEVSGLGVGAVGGVGPMMPRRALPVPPASTPFPRRWLLLRLWLTVDEDALLGAGP